jgi:hypothetical protein
MTGVQDLEMDRDIKIILNRALNSYREPAGKGFQCANTQTGNSV